MAVPICEHVKASGIRCGSPALRRGRLCYYHRGLSDGLPDRGAFMENSYHIPGRGSRIIQLPLLEDAASIQMAYMQVLCLLAKGSIEPVRARVLISAINGAARNLVRMQRELAAFNQGNPKLSRARWGYRMRGNTDALVSHPEQHVGMLPLPPDMEEFYQPYVREGYDWLERGAVNPRTLPRKAPRSASDPVPAEVKQAQSS